MKEVLMLLEELDDVTGGFYSIRIFSDFSGRLISDDDEVLYHFRNERKIKEKLRKLINKNTL